MNPAIRRSPHSAAVAAAVLSALALSPRLAHADCSKDTDCKGSRVCVQGQCVNPPPGSAATVAPPAAAPVAATAAAPAPPPPQRGIVYMDTSQPTPPPPPVAYPAAPVGPQWHYAHPGMRGAGIGLFVFGLVLDLAGTITYVAGSNAESTYCGTGNSGCEHGATAEHVGEGLAVAGSLVTLTGLLLWISGSTVVPGPDARVGLLQRVSPYVAPTRTGTNAGLSVSF